MSKRMYHPCHKLSVPSAKIFWCRHCMQMFEDAISRWKHSRVCLSSPGFRQRNKDAKVIQMYVNPDVVSYSSNVSPGESVVHKPQVKKTSAELKCMICDIKFESVYDMREHVKYPCQKSIVNWACVSTDNGAESQPDLGHIKIRRVEAEDDILGSNTALSVLAEASKHVESLALKTPAEQREEVIEELPEVDENIIQTTSDSFTVHSTTTTSPESKTDPQKVIVAYPRVGFVRPELGRVLFLLQGENGVDLPESFFTTEIIHDCLRETVKQLSIGQIIEVQLSSKDKSYREFVVGANCSIWPYSGEDQGYSGSTSNTQTHIVELVTETPDQTPEIQPQVSTLEQILRGNIEYQVKVGGVIEYLKHKNRSHNSNTSPGTVASEPPSLTQHIPVNPQEAGVVEVIRTEGAEPDTIVITTNNYQVDSTGDHTTNIQIVGEEKSHLAESSIVEGSRTSDSIVALGNSLLTKENLVNNQSIIQTPCSVSEDQVIIVELEQPEPSRDQVEVSVIMASGEQLGGFDDLFGFEELIEDKPKKVPVAATVPQSKSFGPAGSSAITPSNVEYSDRSKRSENEVVVPILFEKTGVRKYKVLARQKVEDDVQEEKKDGIAGPSFKATTKDQACGRSERDSPNSTEQKKENISKKTIVKKKVVDKSHKIFHEKGPDNKTKHVIHPKQNPGGAAQVTHQVTYQQDVLVKKVKKSSMKVKSDICQEKAKTKAETGDKIAAKSLKTTNTKTNDESIKKGPKIDSVKKVKVKSKKEGDVVIKGKIKVDNDVTKVKGDTVSKEKMAVVKEKAVEKSASVKGKIKEISKDFKEKTDDNGKLTDTEKKTIGKSVKEKTVEKSVSVEEKFKEKSQDFKEKADEKLTEMKKKIVVKKVPEKTIRSNGSKSTVMNVASKSNESRERTCLETKQVTPEKLIKQTRSDNSDTDANSPKFNCRVKLNRDPSIESIVSSDDKKDDNVNKMDDNACRSKSDETDSNEAGMSRQNSLSEIKVPVDMVFDATDISVRKSGRLKSAKCASRYRGDYGIRVDTYTKLVKQKESGSGDGVDSPMSDSSKLDDSDSVHSDISRFCVSDNERYDTDIDYQRSVLRKKRKLSKVEKEDKDCDMSELCYRCGGRRVSGEERAYVMKENDSCLCSGQTSCENDKCKTCESKRNNRLRSDTNGGGDKRTDCLHQVPSEHSQFHTQHICDCQPSTDTTSKPGSSKQFDGGTHDRATKKVKLVKKLANVNDTVSIYAKKADHYVHSVGKSVKKIQNMKEGKLNFSKCTQSNVETVLSPESSPSKENPNPVLVLENLRQMLFQQAGADVKVADNKPKRFECKLISSKCKTSQPARQVVTPIPETETTAENPTPICSTPKSEMTGDLLEEISVSLSSLQKQKQSSKKGKGKRKKFEDKKFILRSMSKEQEIIDDTESEILETAISSVTTACDDDQNEETVIKAKTSKKKVHSKSDLKAKAQADKTPLEIIKKPAAKPKPVKCQACNHTFRTKELLRKHYPCRVRQTRTWSQNKLRPNRAVRRPDPLPRKTPASVSKVDKSDKQRPQLLMYRKTKFRRVKGKRRRRLYQAIQELMQRRQPMKWPHLSICFDDLSFKEQSLYKIGLMCTGNSSDGLEMYSMEEIDLFERHRAVVKKVSDYTKFFQPCPPDSDSSDDEEDKREDSNQNQGTTESETKKSKLSMDSVSETVESALDTTLETDQTCETSFSIQSTDEGNDIEKDSKLTYDDKVMGKSHNSQAMENETVGNIGAKRDLTSNTEEITHKSSGEKKETVYESGGDKTLCDEISNASDNTINDTPLTESACFMASETCETSNQWEIKASSVTEVFDACQELELKESDNSEMKDVSNVCSEINIDNFELLVQHVEPTKVENIDLKMYSSVEIIKNSSQPKEQHMSDLENIQPCSKLHTGHLVEVEELLKYILQEIETRVEKEVECYNTDYKMWATSMPVINDTESITDINKDKGADELVSDKELCENAYSPTKTQDEEDGDKTLLKLEDSVETSFTSNDVNEKTEKELEIKGEFVLNKADDLISNELNSDQSLTQKPSSPHHMSVKDFYSCEKFSIQDQQPVSKSSHRRQSTEITNDVLHSTVKETPIVMESKTDISGTFVDIVQFKEKSNTNSTEDHSKSKFKNSKTHVNNKSAERVKNDFSKSKVDNEDKAQHTETEVKNFSVAKNIESAQKANLTSSLSKESSKSQNCVKNMDLFGKALEPLDESTKDKKNCTKAKKAKLPEHTSKKAKLPEHTSDNKGEKIKKKETKADVIENRNVKACASKPNTEMYRSHQKSKDVPGKVDASCINNMEEGNQTKPSSSAKSSIHDKEKPPRRKSVDNTKLNAESVVLNSNILVKNKYENVVDYSLIQDTKEIEQKKEQSKINKPVGKADQPSPQENARKEDFRPISIKDLERLVNRNKIILEAKEKEMANAKGSNDTSKELDTLTPMKRKRSKSESFSWINDYKDKLEKVEESSKKKHISLNDYLKKKGMAPIKPKERSNSDESKPTMPAVPDIDIETSYANFDSENQLSLHKDKKEQSEKNIISKASGLLKDFLSDLGDVSVENSGLEEEQNPKSSHSKAYELEVDAEEEYDPECNYLLYDNQDDGDKYQLDYVEYTPDMPDSPKSPDIVSKLMEAFYDINEIADEQRDICLDQGIHVEPMVVQLNLPNINEEDQIAKSVLDEADEGIPIEETLDSADTVLKPAEPTELVNNEVNEECNKTQYKENGKKDEDALEVATEIPCYTAELGSKAYFVTVEKAESSQVEQPFENKADVEVANKSSRGVSEQSVMPIVTTENCKQGLANLDVSGKVDSPYADSTSFDEDDSMIVVDEWVPSDDCDTEASDKQREIYDDRAIDNIQSVENTYSDSEIKSGPTVDLFLERNKANVKCDDLVPTILLDSAVEATDLHDKSAELSNAFDPDCKSDTGVEVKKQENEIADLDGDLQAGTDFLPLMAHSPIIQSQADDSIQQNEDIVPSKPQISNESYNSSIIDNKQITSKDNDESLTLEVSECSLLSDQVEIHGENETKENESPFKMCNVKGQFEDLHRVNQIKETDSSFEIDDVNDQVKYVPVNNETDSSSGIDNVQSPMKNFNKSKKMEENPSFVIKYEMNGLVIKENLLTGDKNLVENSSPIKSSSELNKSLEDSFTKDVFAEDSEYSDVSDEHVKAGDATHKSVSKVVDKVMIGQDTVSIKNDDTDTEENDELEELCFSYTNEDTLKVTEETLSTDLSNQHNVPSPNMLDTVKEDAELPADDNDVHIDIVEENIYEKVKDGLDDDTFTSGIQSEDSSMQHQEFDSDHGELSSFGHLEDNNVSKTGCSPFQTLNGTIEVCAESKLTTGMKDFDLKPSLSLAYCDGIDDQKPKQIYSDVCNSSVPRLSEIKALDLIPAISPPMLEKVEVCTDSSEIAEDSSSQCTVISMGSEPPTLEPEALTPQHDNDQEGCDVTESSAKKDKSERHFLDVLGAVCKTPEHSSLDREDNLASTPIHEKKETDFNENIGRHFSDVVNSTQEKPVNEFQYLLDKSEKGEITLASIKDMFSPISKKKKLVSKESLLKIQSGIAQLLSKVKKPVKKDPTWLKRDALAKYSFDKQSRIYDSESEDENEILYPVLEHSQETPSTKVVADNIMEMLDSLNKNGSVADNMSKLLGILAENFGFVGGSNSNKSLLQDSDSDSDDMSGKITKSSTPMPIEKTQKEMIASFMKEGDLPPSLDDIPTAGDTEIEQSSFENMDTVNRAETVEQILCENLEEPKDIIEETPSPTALTIMEGVQEAVEQEVDDLSDTDERHEDVYEFGIFTSERNTIEEEMRAKGDANIGLVSGNESILEHNDEQTEPIAQETQIDRINNTNQHAIDVDVDFEPDYLMETEEEEDNIHPKLETVKHGNNLNSEHYDCHECIEEPAHLDKLQGENESLASFTENDRSHVNEAMLNDNNNTDDICDDDNDDQKNETSTIVMNQPLVNETDNINNESSTDIKVTAASPVEMSGSGSINISSTPVNKCKARTIFKSITELNSIETDEDSNSSEHFDHVKMSLNLSELKVKSEDMTLGHSDYDAQSDLSSIDWERKYVSDIEEEILEERLTEKNMDNQVEEDDAEARSADASLKFNYTDIDSLLSNNPNLKEIPNVCKNEKVSTAISITDCVGDVDLPSQDPMVTEEPPQVCDTEVSRVNDFENTFTEVRAVEDLQHGVSENAAAQTEMSGIDNEPSTDPNADENLSNSGKIEENLSSKSDIDKEDQLHNVSDIENEMPEADEIDKDLSETSVTEEMLPDYSDQTDEELPIDTYTEKQGSDIIDIGSEHPIVNNDHDTCGKSQICTIVSDPNTTIDTIDTENESDTVRITIDKEIYTDSDNLQSVAKNEFNIVDELPMQTPISEQVTSDDETTICEKQPIDDFKPDLENESEKVAEIFETNLANSIDNQISKRDRIKPENESPAKILSATSLETSAQSFPPRLSDITNVKVEKVVEFVEDADNDSLSASEEINATSPIVDTEARIMESEEKAVLEDDRKENYDENNKILDSPSLSKLENDLWPAEKKENLDIQDTIKTQSQNNKDKNSNENRDNDRLEVSSDHLFEVLLLEKSGIEVEEKVNTDSEFSTDFIEKTKPLAAEDIDDTIEGYENDADYADDSDNNNDDLSSPVVDVMNDVQGSPEQNIAQNSPFSDKLIDDQDDHKRGCNDAQNIPELTIHSEVILDENKPATTDSMEKKLMHNSIEKKLTHDKQNDVNVSESGKTKAQDLPGLFDKFELPKDSDDIRCKSENSSLPVTLDKDSKESSSSSGSETDEDHIVEKPTNKPKEIEGTEKTNAASEQKDNEDSSETIGKEESEINGKEESGPLKSGKEYQSTSAKTDNGDTARNDNKSEEKPYQPVITAADYVFCESIGEKVKRKQRERARPLTYNPWQLLDGDFEPARKQPRKEISIFRSSILEKRAREKSLPKDTEGKTDKPKYRRSSKDTAHKLESLSRNTFHKSIKECSISLTKLTEEMIQKYTCKKRPLRVEEDKTNQKYTHRKRSLSEDKDKIIQSCTSRKRPLSEEDDTERPPIKVKIQLNRITIPPNSPYGSTSDTNRSGYESENESSDQETDIDTSYLSDRIPDADETKSSIEERKEDISNTREPIRIKMKELLTKMNTCEKSESSSAGENIDNQNIDNDRKEPNDESDKGLFDGIVNFQRDSDIKFYISDPESTASKKTDQFERASAKSLDINAEFSEAFDSDGDCDMDSSVAEAQKKVEDILNATSDLSDNESRLDTSKSNDMELTPDQVVHVEPLIKQSPSKIMNMVRTDIQLSESDSEDETLPFIPLKESVKSRTFDKDLSDPIVNAPITATVVSDLPTNSEGTLKTGMSEPFDIETVCNVNENLAVTSNKRLLDEHAHLSAVNSLEFETFDRKPCSVDNIDNDGMYFAAIEEANFDEVREAVDNLESVTIVSEPMIVENDQPCMFEVVETEVPLVKEMGESSTISTTEPHSLSSPAVGTPADLPDILGAKSKYLYGINDDSQSSAEVVEELITDNIVPTDNILTAENILPTNNIVPTDTMIMTDNIISTNNTLPMDSMMVSNNLIRSDNIMGSSNIVPMGNILPTRLPNQDLLPPILPTATSRNDLSNVLDEFHVPDALIESNNVMNTNAENCGYEMETCALDLSSDLEMFTSI